MKHIVLVEDDEPIRFIFQVAFKSDNYHLISLESGEKIINEELDAPDLFILDKQIAGVNGLDICRFVKSSDKFGNVPVIIISADVDIVAQAREAGADDAIPKPFSLRTLRETVTKYSPETVTAVDTDH